MNITKEITLFLVNKQLLDSLSLTFEQLINDIKAVIESNPDINGLKELLKSAHDVIETVLTHSYKVNTVTIDDNDYLFHSELFYNLVEDGKKLFKDITGVDDINHVEEEAWTYNLDTPIWYGILTAEMLRRLIKEQRDLLDTPFKLVEKANTPAAEIQILKGLEDLYSKKINNTLEELVIVFIEKDQLQYEEY